MADEKEKLDIEDIKDPESEDEIDIDKAVSEEESEEPEHNNQESTQEKAAETEKVLEETNEEPTPVPEKPRKTKKASKKGWVKYLAIAMGVALVTAAIVFGALYWQKQNKPQEEIQNNHQAEDAEVEESEQSKEGDGVVTEEVLYINSEVGLNLREAPNTKAKVLIIIPYATKIVVLEEQTGWVKTTYDNKTGWVSVDYTQATSPLVYENETYGFGLTFKASWAGYKFVEYKNSESTTVKTYYICLPTTDKNWDETMTGIPKGYASLFVMGVYTKAEWAEMAGGEILPAKLGEGDKYVYTYLPGQAHATDLASQYGEISQIIKTFEVLN